MTERLDTKYFHLSDEIYRNRKDDAMKRVQAVIDFVNNDKECRSVQLLRYFGEDIKRSCGECDVCSTKNKNTLTDQEYQEINKIIVDELKENETNIYDILEILKDYREEKVLTSIKWMLDNNIIKQDEEGVLTINNVQ